MEQESEYLTALESATRYEIDGDRLVLFNGTDTRAVIYEAALDQAMHS